MIRRARAGLWFLAVASANGLVAETRDLAGTRRFRIDRDVRALAEKTTCLTRTRLRWRIEK